MKKANEVKKAPHGRLKNRGALPPLYNSLINKFRCD